MKMLCTKIIALRAYADKQCFREQDGCGSELYDNVIKCADTLRMLLFTVFLGDFTANCADGHSASTEDNALIRVIHAPDKYPEELQAILDLEQAIAVFRGRSNRRKSLQNLLLQS